jgi:hypothetical protein
MKLLIIPIILLLAISIFAQSDLYIPKDIQKAYDKGSRALDGKPVENYWTNRSDYKMNIHFDPFSGLLDGKENITYFNNSPDTLRQIVIRLYQDFFKKGNGRDWDIGPLDIHDGVNITHLQIGDSLYTEDPQQPTYRRTGTNITVPLAQSGLPPNSKIELKIHWNFKISQNVQVRMGKYDSTSYFIAYWYPQIAVYDDINGWDTYHFGGLQEFYNDQCNFEVNISVPENFVIWATGTLQNANEVLSEKYLNRYEQAHYSTEAVNIIEEKDIGLNDVTVKGKRHLQWRFKAQNVPDFAFAASDHYLWDALSLKIEETEQPVFISAAYKAESEDFKEVAWLAKEMIHYFSTELPGIAYPYPAMTIFNGKGGMEFPMIVNDGSAKKRGMTVHVTSHEIAHTYFPFMMGINERKYAWMDEGWAQMLPFAIQNRLEKTYDPIARNMKQYTAAAGLEMEIPPMVPSIVMSGNAFRPTYRTAAYNRSAAAYYILYDMLGDSLFTKAIQNYINNWKYKHPTPYDFFFTFNRVSKMNLNWFWKAWFFEFGYPDLALVEYFTDKNNDLHILIEKKGNIPVPVELTIYFKGGGEQKIYKTAAIWQTGAKRITLKIKSAQPIKNMILGSDHTPDVYPENNVLWAE